MTGASSATGPSAAAGAIAVVGGSGFYEFLDDVTETEVVTPYGSPSAPVALGRVGDRLVAFLPRHGPDHRFPPHRVNYRANLWALREAGAGTVLGSFAAGSLRPSIHPGELVVCDQLVDRTWGRPDTYFDGPEVQHLPFADPYDAGLRRVLVDAGRSTGSTVHDGGTVVVIQGPRFATRAESRWYRAQGWDVIGMTQYPEAALAAELGLRYAAVALVTDHDTGLEGVDGIEAVTQEEVFAVMAANVERVRALFRAAIAAIAAAPAIPAEQA